MVRYVIVALALLALWAAPARAQDRLLASCAAAQPTVSPQVPISQDVVAQFRLLCAQVVNAVGNVQPAMGIAFSGGNPVLGTATTLGTRVGMLPRVSLTARANLALARLPDLFGYGGELTTGSETLAAMETFGLPLGSLQGDLSIGVFNGISLGPMLGGVGAVDLLGSVAFIPQISEFGLADPIVNAGGGLRVGLIKQGLLMPGVSVSGMYRMMREVSFGDIAAGDPGEFSANLTTLSVRGIVSKGIAMFDLAVGAGYDQYSSDVGLGWRLVCATADCQSAAATAGQSEIVVEGAVAGELSTAAWNVFADVALNVLMLNLVGEVGYQKAMDVLTPESLQQQGFGTESLTVDALEGGRFFGSVGLRLAI